VQGHLLLTNCLQDEVTRPAIEQALKEDTLLWLNLGDTGPDTIALLKLVTPQRDMVSSMLNQVIIIPGMSAETEKYIRDLYDHLIRISDMVDSYRDLLSGSLEAYMSMVSNRLNDVMKQLTIIATVFLPLSFLTGFFGQNFAWLLNHIGSPEAFFGIGLGTEVLAVAALLFMFRRRGWM